MKFLISLDPESNLSLQHQIRQKLVEAILSGALPAGERLISSRKLCRQLKISRNTVVLAFSQLVEEGYLHSRERSGLFVNTKILEGRIGYSIKPSEPKAERQRWLKKITISGLDRQQYSFPDDWQNHPHPFIDGYFDASLYPVSQWQEASRLAFGALQAHQIAAESTADDPMLINEIRTKILPRRGVSANRDEILITSGSHHALYLLANLLTNKRTRVAMEDPGSPALRSSLALTRSIIQPQPIDEHGLILDARLNDCDLVFVTPSHQLPTAVTMPMSRRKQLIEQARRLDQLIIEDDSECESNYLAAPQPAIRSLDTENRVIYLSSLPRALAPGLGLGFIVAAPSLIREARRLRRLMVGNPPKSNQRTAAFFISLGHYDAFMSRINKIFSQRWNALRDALNHYLPGSIKTIPNQGGTAFWVSCPSQLSIQELVSEAAKSGILIEPVADYYADPEYFQKHPEKQCFRMGVTSLDEAKIRHGVKKLAELIRALSGKQWITLENHPHTPLSGEQIQRQLAAATLLTKTVYGAPCTIELRADGSMVGCAGHADEEHDIGRWWVEGNRWFRQWEDWAYGEKLGFYVTVNAGQISWFNQNGRIIDTAVIKQNDRLKMQLV